MTFRLSPESSSPFLPACPLCGEASSGPSWLGCCRYRDKEYRYLACGSCGSLYCHPMPDADDLATMYGVSYRTGSDGGSIEDPTDPDWVLAWLDRLPTGTFLDYGCGSGELLARASRRGWTVVGVELTPQVVEDRRRSTGLPVVTRDEALGGNVQADVLHLGDVLEHLTDLDFEMPRILSLLKDGGVVLAQGPLEANANLFHWTIRLRRSLSGRKPSEMPPYHVVLATVVGQWSLFRRFGLSPLEERISEVFWPAPARLSEKELFAPRSLGLYSLRVASRALSRLRSDRWGNRFRYAGRKGESLSP